MTVAVVGTRGRIVLPQEVRERLGLHEGDTVFFLMEGDRVRLARAPEDFGEYLGLYGSQPDHDWQGPSQADAAE